MNTMTENTNDQAKEPSTEVAISIDAMIDSLQAIDVDDKQQLSTKNVATQLNAVIAVLKQLKVANGQQPSTARDRGPKSDRDMVEDDARRIMLGDLKDASHKAAAEALGLSYGQVYSARKGFTFKGVYKEMITAAAAAKA